MGWTTRTPLEPGFYWAQVSTDERTHPVGVTVVEIPSYDWHTVWVIGEDVPFAIDDIAWWWSGPMTPPTNPPE